MQQIRIKRGRRRPFAAVVAFLAVMFASAVPASATPPGSFAFTPLAASAPCTAGGGDLTEAPIALPEGFDYEILESESSDADFKDNADMHSLNETGAQAGRFLYHTHENASSGSISRTDLWTGETETVVLASHYERLDGIEWTPWGTVLFAEEVRAARSPKLLDPTVPQALGGLVYEYDPVTEVATVRPAIGSRAHEGLAFDARGNLYGISENNRNQGPTLPGGGAIFKFEPDRRGDLSSGTLYALKVHSGTTGAATWMKLDATQSVVDSDVAAASVNATKWLKPEDIEVRGEVLYVAISDEHRVIAVDLRHTTDAEGNQSASVWDYVRPGLNAPEGDFRTGGLAFSGPDNLAMDAAGHLYISEDSGGKAPQRTRGQDVWVASPPTGDPQSPAESVRLFASMKDCNAEPSGIYFDPGGRTLYVHVMHRGGSAPGDLFLPDMSIAVKES